MAKHNRYATRQIVADYINLEHKLFNIRADLGLRRHTQVRRKQFLRNKVFGRSPLYIRSFMYYLYRMFLDWVFSMDFGAWYITRFMVFAISS